MSVVWPRLTETAVDVDDLEALELGAHVIRARRQERRL